MVISNLQAGLDKIVSTQEQVGGLQEQLTAMEPVLIKTQAEVEVMIVTIMSDKEEAGKTQREASTHINLDEMPNEWSRYFGERMFSDLCNLPHVARMESV